MTQRIDLAGATPVALKNCGTEKIVDSGSGNVGSSFM
jgi:hypothetical protein